MKWYESSNETIFRQFGPIFDQKLIALLKLGDFYLMDASDIKDLPKDIAYTYDTQFDYLFEDGNESKEEFIEGEKFQIYERYFQNYRTNLIYTIGSFLFFLDRIKEIEVSDERIPLSRYFYFLNAVKSLGDSVGLMKNIAKLLIFSRVFHTDRIQDANIKEKHKRALIENYKKHLAYTKDYRDYVVHKGFSKFFSDFSVPKLKMEHFRQLPEDYVIDATSKKYKPSDLLTELFDDVAKGINEASKYLIGEVLKCPKAAENLRNDQC